MRILILFLLFQSTEPLSDRVLVQEHETHRSHVAPLTLHIGHVLFYLEYLFDLRRLSEVTGPCLREVSTCR